MEIVLKTQEKNKILLISILSFSVNQKTRNQKKIKQRFHNHKPPMEIDPIASNSRFPVYDVKPRLVAQIKMPARAALSSSNTATAFGSLPRETEKKMNIGRYVTHFILYSFFTSSLFPTFSYFTVLNLLDNILHSEPNP